MDPCEIGIRIREYRLLRSLTQEQLAEAADLSTPYVSCMERGIKTASIRTYERIASALDVPLAYLLAEELSANTGDFPQKPDPLLENASPRELRVLYDTVRALRRSLREQRFVDGPDGGFPPGCGHRDNGA